MPKESSYIIRLAAALISITLLVLGLYLLQDLLILLAAALVLALLLHPLASWLEKKGFPRSLSIAICLILTVAVISGILAILTVQMVEFASDWPIFIKKAESYISSLQSFLSRNLNISRKKQMLEISNQTINLLKNSGTILSTTFGTIIHSITTIILIPIFVFFFLYYRSFFAQFLEMVFPNTESHVLKVIMRKTGQVVQGYLVGLMVVMLIVSMLNTIGFWWIGVDYPFFFGILTGLLLLIPYIGIWMGASGPVILSLIVLSPSHAFAVIAWVASVQFIEANLITPLVIGSKVSINPMVAMLALLLGEMIWGIPGLILALPLTAIVKVIFDYVPSLQAYGYVLGEAPSRKKKEVKLEKMEPDENEET
ncbi:AI-2E family transporter [Aquirufa rosea]|uniref:AI-2E family transporter n=1 Tax=Aquirufa rosea TaxID=2509241 RepID=A0A4Q1C1I3_9BACT|nr:AI-2E family transporter [Aquirufa rosea]RXK50968.1 AI-2E family transporter [Aquirufa rosea]